MLSGGTSVNWIGHAVSVAVDCGVLVCIAVGTTVVASGMTVLVGGNGVRVLVLEGCTGVLVCIAVGTTVVASGMTVLVGGKGVRVLVLVGCAGVGVGVSDPVQPVTVTEMLVRGISV